MTDFLGIPLGGWVLLGVGVLMLLLFLGWNRWGAQGSAGDDE